MSRKTQAVLVVAVILVMGLAAWYFFQPTNAAPDKSVISPPRMVEAPRLAPVTITSASNLAETTPLATSAALPEANPPPPNEMTPGEKALAVRQALAAGRPAPQFSSSPSTAPPDNPTPLESQVKDLLQGAPATIHLNELEIFELEPGSASSYRLRGDVVQVPLLSGVTDSGKKAFYLPALNRFYLVWEGMGASTLHYYGPFDGNPYQIFGLTPPENPRR